MRNDPAMLGASKYPREAYDLYETPAWCVRALMRHVAMTQPVWEPAYGRGAIARVLCEGAGVEVMCSDIVRHNDDPIQTMDFLAETSGYNRDIITNPPYLLDEEFVRHALALTKPYGGLVAMLMRNEWDCAKTRRDLFMYQPFAMKLALFDRPLWFADRKAQPRHNFAWFVWDWSHEGDPIIRYDGDDTKPHPLRAAAKREPSEAA